MPPNRKYFSAASADLDVALVERRQDVEREAGQFERNEDHQDVLGTDQEHHPDCRQQEQREVLAHVRGETGFHRDQLP